MENYKKLLQRALEKAPFFSYMQRLKFFVLNPDIGNSFAHHQQKENSLLDIFSGLGLLTVAVSLIILYDRSFNEFKIVLAFNPLFIAFSWVSNAVLFSLISALLLTVLLRFSSSGRTLDLKTNFYNIFTHGLRCYAIYGLLLGLLFVKACGALYLDGQSLELAFQSWYWQVYILLVLGVVLFRLFINPYTRYCRVVKNSFINWIIVTVIITFSFEPLKLVPLDYTEKMIDQTVLCELFKQGDFIQRIPDNRRKEVIDKVCSVTNKLFNDGVKH